MHLDQCDVHTACFPIVGQNDGARCVERDTWMILETREGLWHEDNWRRPDVIAGNSVSE